MKTTTAALGTLVLGASLATLQACRHQAPKAHIETAALLAGLAQAKQPATATSSVQAACALDDGCLCAETAARAALDADLHDLALRMLGAAPKGCPHEATLLGERAEALARAGSDSAQSAADLALKANASNPYAELALARIIYDKDKMGESSEHAAKALKFGRGAEAERLLGRSAMARSLFKEAEAHFQSLLRANPNDAEAAYSSAVCADKAGDYRGAREGFLQTLRIDPKHIPARVHLVVLTHNAGANDEARHHLAKLTEIVPKDSPEVGQLTQLLAGADADGGAPHATGLTQINGGVVPPGMH